MKATSSSIKRLARKLLGPPVMSETDLLYQLLRRKEQGAVMIDVGAHHGESLRPFAEDGWQVHAFEPDPTNRDVLLQNFGNLPNVTVIPRAVSNSSGKLPLYRSYESSGISSLRAFAPSHQPGNTVDVTTLRAYLDGTGLQNVTFLKVDAEGYDRFILLGHPWDLIRPRAVLCEFEDRKTLQLGYRWTDLAEDLVGRGYRILVSEWYPVRAYGTAHVWRRFTRYPSRLADEAGHGNLIAVAGADFDRLCGIGGRFAARLRLRRRVDSLRTRV